MASKEILDWIYRVYAQKDEECYSCGYPFDVRDLILHNENTDMVYCSRSCVYAHEALIESKRELDAKEGS